MKRAYVAINRRLRAVAASIGLIGLLDRWARRSRVGVWARSLFSIHDLEELLVYDVPWWTFKSADEVESFLAAHPGARVFEWGSGASTAWLSKRAGSVTSIEHDARWAEFVRPVLKPNADVRVVEAGAATGEPGEIGSNKPGHAGLDFSSYVAAIDDTTGDFDLIVVDGRAREACFAKAVTRLAPGGVLVFDNVDRERYRDAISGSPVPVDVTWTRGLTPALPYPTRTALVRLRG